MPTDPTTEFSSPASTVIGDPNAPNPTSPPDGVVPGGPVGDRRFFGHPRGLSTLFFTEFWERFSYYGMRALLILFMTATVAEGGLGFDAATAGPIYGLYTAMVYLMSLPGGWIADRFLGQRRAVLIGGIIIAAGHYCLMMSGLPIFYTGLAFIVFGTGLLKPNISTMVGQLYSEDDGSRRDAGFSIFYMGINAGSFVSSLICPFLAQQPWFRTQLVSWGLRPESAWHWGFGAAAIGMTFGLIWYVIDGKSLGNAGAKPAPEADPVLRAKQNRSLAMGLGGLAAVVALVAVLNATGAIHLTIDGFVGAFNYIISAVVILFFGGLFLFGKWSPVERKRLVVVLALFVAASLFWAAFEQAGSTLSLFAQDTTNRMLGGFEIPSGWFQALNALFIIFLAPVFAGLWIKLGAKRKEPSSPAKFSVGLLFVGLGFVVMMGGAIAAGSGAKVSPMWLVLTYLLHTIGELCLSPVGLSTMTKLAPPRIVSLIMGVWFLAAAVGNFLGGQVAGLYEKLTLPALFGLSAGTTIFAAFILALLIKPIKELMGGVK